MTCRGSDTKLTHGLISGQASSPWALEQGPQGHSSESDRVQDAYGQHSQEHGGILGVYACRAKSWTQRSSQFLSNRGHSIVPSLSPSHTPPSPKMAPAPHCRPLRARNPHGSRSAQSAFLTQTQTFPSKYKPVYNFGSADFLLPATRVTSRAVLPQNHFLTGKLLPSVVAAGERGTRECARRRRKKRRFYLEVQV